jgi:uncharacterized protein YjiS (DUF1127 family)
MAKINHNQVSAELSLGKFGSLFFTRQTPLRGAATHPSIFSNLAAGFKAWREQREAAAELSRLSDRELADIGLTRQQIPAVIRGQVK